MVRPVLLDVAAALAVTLLSVAEFVEHGGWVGMFGLAMAVTILLRRHRPLLVTAAVAALAIGQALVSRSPAVPLFEVAVLVATYSAVRYAGRMRDAYLAAGLVAAAIVAQVGFEHATPWWENLLDYIPICAGCWFYGLAMRARARYLASLEERAVLAERERDVLARVAVAEERTSIARDLHDIIAHSLAVMIAQADGATYTVDSEPHQARAATRTIADVGREALIDMHRILDVLRGDRTTTDDRRRITIEQLADRARAAGLAVNLRLTGPATPLPAAVKLTIHRVVQEALTNVLRHAGPGTHASVHLHHTPNAVTVDITDNGAEQPQDSRTGHGLIGMRERVTLHRGTLTTGPIPTGGWRVHAVLPLR